MHEKEESWKQTREGVGLWNAEENERGERDAIGAREKHRDERAGEQRIEKKKGDQLKDAVRNREFGSVQNRGTGGLSTRSVRGLLVLIVLLAAILRLERVDQPFVDVFAWREASTAMMAENLAVKDWNILLPEVNWAGPDAGYQGREFQLFTFIVALLYQVFGVSESVGRTVASVCGVWSVFCFYQLLRALQTEQLALAAAAVLAVLPGAVLIDRSFLPDPLMLSLALTGAWQVAVALQRSSGPRSLTVPATFNCLAWLTKLPALVTMVPVVWLGHAAGREGEHRNDRRRKVILSVLLALIPVVAYYALTIYVGRSSANPHVAGLHSFHWLGSPREWAAQWPHFRRMGEHAIDWLWTPPFIAFAAVGLFGSMVGVFGQSETADGSRLHTADGFFLSWAAACTLLLAVGIQELRSNWWNLHVFNPPFAYFCARGALMAVQRIRPRTLRLSIALCALVASAAYGRSRLTPLYEMEFRGRAYRMGLALQEVSEPVDLAITIAYPTGNPVSLYYAHRVGWVLPAVGGSDDWISIPERWQETARRVESARRQGARFLAITRDHGSRGEYLFRPSSPFRRFLRQRASRVVVTREFEIWRFLDRYPEPETGVAGSSSVGEKG